MIKETAPHDTSDLPIQTLGPAVPPPLPTLWWWPRPQAPGWTPGNRIHPLLPSGQNIRDKISDSLLPIPAGGRTVGVRKRGQICKPRELSCHWVCSGGSKTAFPAALLA